MSTPPSKPPEPNRKTPPSAETPGSPLRAILTGLAIDIGGTTLIQIVLTTLYALRLSQSGLTPDQVRDVLRQLPPQSVLALLFPLLGSLCSVAGGYACARIVRRDEFRIGAVMAALSAGLGLMTGDDGGPDDLVVLFTLCTVACVMLGVKYGRERNQRLDAVLAAPAADDGPAP